MILIQHKIKEENFDEHRTEDIGTLRQLTHYMLRNQFKQKTVSYLL